MATRRTIAKAVEAGAIVAVHWRDHTGFKNMQLVPNSLTLTRLTTYGEVLSPKNDEGGIELITEREGIAGGDSNDGCVIDLGAVRKVSVYRLEAEYEWRDGAFRLLRPQ